MVDHFLDSISWNLKFYYSSHWTLGEVEGKEGLKLLRNKLRVTPLALWHGSAGAVGATFAGHYPWFFTYNYLQGILIIVFILGVKMNKYIYCFWSESLWEATTDLAQNDASLDDLFSMKCLFKDI